MSLRPDLQLVNGMVAAFGSLALAAITYYLTKQRERDAELRSESLAHYKMYVESINGIIGEQWSPEGSNEYARAFNNLHLFAPQAVIEALHEYQKELNSANPERTDEGQRKRYTDLMFQIRKDLKVKPKDNVRFEAWLWGGGGSPKEETQSKQRATS